jgi:hypothetical protein
MHKIVSTVSVGSIGDLGRIARAFANGGFDIRAVGGGEGLVRGTTLGRTDGLSTGLVSFLVEPDEDDQAIIDLLEGLPLDNGRTLEGVKVHPALAVELSSDLGQLATVGELLGAAGINIMGALSVDVHLDWAVISLGFEDASVQDAAKEALENGGIRVLPPNGAQSRRDQVDKILAGVHRGDEV